MSRGSTVSYSIQQANCSFISYLYSTVFNFLFEVFDATCMSPVIVHVQHVYTPCTKNCTNMFMLGLFWLQDIYKYGVNNYANYYSYHHTNVTQEVVS